MEEFWKWIGGAFSAIAFFLWGNDVANINMLIAFCVFVLFDIAVGAYISYKNGEFRRQILLDGFAKKIGELILITIAHWADISQIAGTAAFLQKGVTAYLIGYELLSILSNLKTCGVPIPQNLQDAVQTYSNKEDGKAEDVTK